MKMFCTRCGGDIPDGTKYLAIFRDQPNGGIRVAVGCEHYSPPDVDKADQIAGGADCFLHMMIEYVRSLQCNPRRNGGGS